MHIIITMAGHSRRFNDLGYEGPKAFLDVGGMKMIEHVINMFDPNVDSYHIVMNEDQAKEAPWAQVYFEQIAKKIAITVVSNHELGPVYSSLQVMGIGDEEEVIVTYCDFIVQWDYQKFIRHIQSRNCDGAIVSFKGFHPASFGDTYYAYMQVKDDRMIELREKESFTEVRSNEHASTGIYYFKKYSLLMEYGNKWLQREQQILPEVYVSLLYNDMVDDQHLVVIHEVDKFICLGTPDDYEQFLFWYSYFNENQEVIQYGNNYVKRIGMIPMAGNGSRFRNYGYRVAKPLIQVQGRPIVLRTVESMPEQDQWFFLPRQIDLERNPIERTLLDFSPDSRVFGVSEHTSGQAATCMLVADQIEDDAELMIASADYEHRYEPEAWQAIINNHDIDGAIWTYRSKSMVLKNPEMFAYCIVGDDDVTISKVVEKQIISDTPSLDPLVIGTFWYRRAIDFKTGAQHLIENDITINGEHYVGTSINHLISLGKKFVIFDVDRWISFGDPFELQVLEYWQDYFDPITH
jgi:NDP-sugar pyrophosphorylase family protein